MASKSSSTATAALSKLSLDPPKPTKATPAKSKKAPVADSWEDESSSDDEEDHQGASTPTNKPASTPSSSSGFAAPPPTPATPTYSTGAPWQSITAPDSPEAAEKKRPEKTDAVARRMIASALGVKAPKLTEEQRAYERAMRDKERKKREAEKEEEKRRKAEAEQAKIAMWED